jgi:hypothetical protein
VVFLAGARLAVVFFAAGRLAGAFFAVATVSSVCVSGASCTRGRELEAL